MFRYVAFAWDTRSTQSTPRVAQFASRLTLGPWTTVFSLPGLSILCADQNPTALLACAHGVVLGSIFKRFTHSALMQPSAGELDRWLLDDSLIEHSWGNYVAFAVPGADTVRICRDPAGTLPCVHVHEAQLHVFASNIEDVQDLRMVPLTPSQRFLAARLSLAATNFSVSALESLDEVIGGERWQLTFTGDRGCITRDLKWRPAQFISRSQRISDARIAAECLREAVIYATRAARTGSAPVLVRSSGGLDSAIVVGALARSYGHEVVGYTYYDPTNTTNELRWSHLIAEHHRIQTLDIALRAEDVDLSRIPHLRPSGTPTSTLPYLQRAPLERELCAQLGASSVWTGLGGDSGLCRDSIALIAREAFSPLRLFDPTWWRLCARIARYTELSIYEVISDAWTRHSSCTSDSVLKAFTHLVNPEVAKQSQSLATHPWLLDAESLPTLPRRLSPLLQQPEFYHLSVTRDQPAPTVISPLLSRPVVETCLRIPAELHFLNGIERGLARMAFAPDLPCQVRARCWKDRAPGFLERVIQKNRGFLLEFLLDGHLVRERWLSAQAIEAALAPASARTPVSAIELLNHLDLEAWMRHWY